MRNSFGLVISILVFLVLGCVCSKAPDKPNQVSNNSTSSTTVTPTMNPNPNSVNAMQPTAENISKGEKIYKKIESRYNLPVMFGWRAKDITLMIPTKDWNELSKEDKANLVFYAQTLTSDISKNPKPFVDRWTRYYKVTEQLERGGEYDGLTQDSYLEQASDLCGNCWNITTGTIKGKSFIDDKTVVSGSQVKSFFDSLEK